MEPPSTLVDGKLSHHDHTRSGWLRRCAASIPLTNTTGRMPAAAATTCGARHYAAQPTNREPTRRSLRVAVLAATKLPEKPRRARYLLPPPRHVRGCAGLFIVQQTCTIHKRTCVQQSCLVALRSSASSLGSDRFQLRCDALTMLTIRASRKPALTTASFKQLKNEKWRYAAPLVHIIDPRRLILDRSECNSLPPETVFHVMTSSRIREKVRFVYAQALPLGCVSPGIPSQPIHPSHRYILSALLSS